MGALSAQKAMFGAALVAALLFVIASYSAPILGFLPALPLMWFAVRYEWHRTIQCGCLFLFVSLLLSGPIGAIVTAWLLVAPALIVAQWHRNGSSDLASLHLNLCQWAWVSLLVMLGFFAVYAAGGGQSFDVLVMEATGLTADKTLLPESLSSQMSDAEMQSMLTLAIQLLPGLSVSIWCLMMFLSAHIIIKTSPTYSGYKWQSPNKSSSWLLYIVALTIAASLFGSEALQPLAYGSFIILLYAYAVFFMLPLHFRLANQPVKWVVLSACYGSIFILVWPVMMMACWAMGNHAASLCNNAAPKQ